MTNQDEKREAKPTDIILKAKELIERDGWTNPFTKRGWVNPFTRAHKGWSLDGALLSAAQGRSAEFNEACRQLSNMLALDPDPFLFRKGADAPLVKWNNAPDRTKAEVLALLAEAVK